jgi:hypothetical protein
MSSVESVEGGDDQAEEGEKHEEKEWQEEEAGGERPEVRDDENYNGPEVRDDENYNGPLVSAAGVLNSEGKVKFASTTDLLQAAVKEKSSNGARSGAGGGGGGGGGLTGIGKWKNVLNSQAASMPSFAEFMKEKDKASENLELLRRRGEEVSSPLAQSIAMMRGALQKEQQGGQSKEGQSTVSAAPELGNERELPKKTLKEEKREREHQAQQLLFAQQGETSPKKGKGIPLDSSDDIVNHFFERRAARDALLRRTNGFVNRANKREATRKAVKQVLHRDEFEEEFGAENNVDDGRTLTMDELLQSLRDKEEAMEDKCNELDPDTGEMLAARRGRRSGRSGGACTDDGTGSSRPKKIKEARILSKELFAISQARLQQQGPVSEGRLNIAQRTQLEEHRRTQIRLDELERRVREEDNAHHSAMDAWDLRRGEMTRKKKRALSTKGEQWRRQATVAHKLVVARTRSKNQLEDVGGRKSQPHSASAQRYGPTVPIEEVWKTAAQIKKLEDGMIGPCEMEEEFGGTAVAILGSALGDGIKERKRWKNEQQLLGGTGEPRLDAVLDQLGAPTHCFARAFLRL